MESIFLKKLLLMTWKRESAADDTKLDRTLNILEDIIRTKPILLRTQTKTKDL